MTKTELKESWDDILLKLSRDIDPLFINTFIKPLKPCKINEKTQTIYLLDESGTGMIKNSASKHTDELQKAVFDVFNKEYTIEITNKEPGNAENDENIDHFVAEDPLRPEYTFESFVNGPNNALAYAAALSVADSFSKKYNPLFIYSASGLGKTHLMHAIGHYVIKNHPRKKVLYVPAETFVSELVEAIRTQTQNKFKAKYRNVDYLLLDDVQFLAGKSKAIEEELFNTFEHLDNSNKQIVFTSDRPPKELGDLPERLRTRFSQGIPVDIQPPEYETKLAILKNKAILEGFNINDENLLASLDIIAKSLEGNIRELEGAFNRVKFSAIQSGGEFSVQQTKKVLSEVFNTKEKEISPDLIKKIVAKYYNIKVSDLESSKRSQNIAYPRHIAIYLIRENCKNYSSTKIGELFGGRDHTTIMHSCDKIAGEIKDLPDIKNAVLKLQEQIDN